MKKICILRHAYFPDDPRVRKEAYALEEAGYEVDIICLRRKGQKAREMVNNIRVSRIPLSHKREGLFRYFYEYAVSFCVMSIVLTYRMLKRRYNCIQVHTMPDVLVFSTFIPKLLGAKVLLDLHEPTPELWITKYGEKKYRFLLKMQTWLEQRSIKYADKCITVTNTLQKRFAERGADISKISVIPNVCDEKTLLSKRQNLNDSKNETFRLVTHGLIEERYGHDTIIQAIALLKKELSDIRFDIYGKGEHKSKIEQLVREFKCVDIVTLKGFVSTEELVKDIFSADAGIIAMKRSPYSELVDTNKMYEYIHLNVPVIASRLPAVENTFDDSCVMFFESGNHEDLARCIVELYNHPEKRKELSENAYHRYEKIRWRKAKKIYLKVIEELIGEVKE